jgi:hypothetical protein
MSVATLSAIEQTIRTRLLTFVPTSASTLAVLLGSTTSGAGSDGKLYIDAPPDGLTGFYAVMRLVDMPVTGLDGGAMIKAQCEVTIYGRPRSQASAVKRMGVVVMEAWKNYSYTEVSGRCLAARDIATAALIPYTDPADRDLVAFRLLLPFMATPSFLTG